MKVLRTGDERFWKLPGFSYAPRYLEVESGDGSRLRMAYLDEGPRSAVPTLLLHGEPTWSFLYRKMIPLLVAGGQRVLALDFVGFGRSDKPARISDYTYQRHVDWTAEWMTRLDLNGITLFCQDWGGLIGLRLAAEHPRRFARIVAGNTFLPTGDQTLGKAFHRWRSFALEVAELPVGTIIRNGTVNELPPEVVSAYEAPFPTEEYKAGARAFPQLVPASSDDPAAPANRSAWEVLQRWEKPFLTAFSDSDPITRGADALLQALIPGAKGQPHVTIERAGHFLQEDQGERVAEVVLGFIRG